MPNGGCFQEVISATVLALGGMTMAIRSVLGKVGRRSCSHYSIAGVDCPFLLPSIFRPVKVSPADSKILTHVPVPVEDFDMLQTRQGKVVACPLPMPQPVKGPTEEPDFIAHTRMTIEYLRLKDKMTPPMSCAMILVPEPRPVKVPLDDPQIVTAAREAIEDFNDYMETQLQLVRVLKANEWFSHGRRSRHYYYLTLEAADAGVVKVYKTEVVVGLQSMIPQSFHHVGDYKSMEA